MAEPVSAASGITALITLSTAVLAAGCRYLRSVSSAPEEIRSLVRGIAALNTVLSQLVSWSLYERTGQPEEIENPIPQEVLQDCEDTLHSIQSLIRDCELTGNHRSKNTVNALLWPLKKREIIKNRDRLSRLYASLHTAVSVENGALLRNIQYEQRTGSEAVKEMLRIADDSQDQKIVVWLSPLDHTLKHTTTTSLKQPGTHEWIFKEEIFMEWLDNGILLWLQGSSGTGKTVLM